MKFISEPYKNNLQVSFRISLQHSFPVSSEAVHSTSSKAVPGRPVRVLQDREGPIVPPAWNLQFWCQKCAHCPTTCLHLPLVVPADSSVAVFPAHWAIQDPGRKVFPYTCKYGCLWLLSVWFSEKIRQALVLQRVQAPFHACPGGTQGKGKFEFFEFYFVCCLVSICLVL